VRKIHTGTHEVAVEVRLGITHHAVRQYITRVLGVRLKQSLGDYEAICEFEHRTGTSRREIYKIINSDVTPRLPLTVLNRGTRRVIKGETARYVVDEGRVITCYTGDEDRDQETLNG
jgi:hypothetical protein